MVHYIKIEWIHLKFNLHFNLITNHILKLYDKWQYPKNINEGFIF